MEPPAPHVYDASYDWNVPTIIAPLAVSKVRTASTQTAISNGFEILHNTTPPQRISVYRHPVWKLPRSAACVVNDVGFLHGGEPTFYMIALTQLRNANRTVLPMQTKSRLCVTSAARYASLYLPTHAMCRLSPSKRFYATAFSNGALRSSSALSDVSRDLSYADGSVTEIASVTNSIATECQNDSPPTHV